MTLGAAGPAYRAWSGPAFSCEIPSSWKDVDDAGAWAAPDGGALLSATFDRSSVEAYLARHAGAGEPAKDAARAGLSEVLGVEKPRPRAKAKVTARTVAGRAAKSFETLEDGRVEDSAPGKGAPPPAPRAARKRRVATTVVEVEGGFWVLRLSASEASFARHRAAYERLLATFKPI